MKLCKERLWQRVPAHECRNLDSEESWLTTVHFSKQNQRPHRSYEESIYYSLSRTP